MGNASKAFGLELETGKYIMFVDSDDWVEPDFCWISYDLAVYAVPKRDIGHTRCGKLDHHRWEIKLSEKSNLEGQKAIDER